MPRSGNRFSRWLGRRIMSDQLTPVLAYRRLVLPDERTAPSFLLESVENGSSVGRHSFVGAQPGLEVVARGDEVTVIERQISEGQLRPQEWEDEYTDPTWDAPPVENGK